MIAAVTPYSTARKNAMTNPGYIPEIWDNLACVRCAQCGQPFEICWTNSCAGHSIYHGDCYTEKATT